MFVRRSGTLSVTKLMMRNMSLASPSHSYYARYLSSETSSKSQIPATDAQAAIRTRRSAPNPPKRKLFYKRVLREHAPQAVITHHVVGAVSLSLWTSGILLLGGENLIPIIQPFWDLMGVNQPPSGSLILQLYIAITAHKLAFPFRFSATILCTPAMTLWLAKTNIWMPRMVKDMVQ